MNKCITSLCCAAIGVATLLTPQSADAGQRGLFVGDQYYQPGPYYSGKARDSKMNRLFLFTLQVNADGTLRFNNHIVCQNGTYIGNSVWATQLNTCRGGSVSYIEMAVGNWGSTSFTNIKNLINSQGTGSNTILYRNFQALKNAIRLDAIQMDDENTYDVSTMVKFCKMLKDGLGLWTSLCPYTNQGFWQQVKQQLPDRVTGVWLQCYDGGSNNNPVQWKTALGNTSILFPGCTLFDGPTLIQSKVTNWRAQGNFQGAFVWGDNQEPDPRWGQALINAGL